VSKISLTINGEYNQKMAHEMIKTIKLLSEME